jgi:hypothetical protein
MDEVRQMGDAIRMSAFHPSRTFDVLSYGRPVSNSSTTFGSGSVLAEVPTSFSAILGKIRRMIAAASVLTG